MRPASRYPVDRYLVESSKKMDINEVMDDDLWKPEPALRPEDGCLLRKLHDMLQSTADDLKVLSGELSKYHEPGVQVKTLPTPLDEDFNEKVHIEEVVNAKFYGNKIYTSSKSTAQKSAHSVQDLIASEMRKHESLSNSHKGAQLPVQKKHLKNLEISRTKMIHIPESANNVLDSKSVDLKSNNISSNDKAVLYSEIVYEEAAKKEGNVSQKPFQIQEMPSINIRSELKTQKVINLDILPDSNTELERSITKNNICVISVNHDAPTVAHKEIHRIDVDFEPASIRKISKMSSYESSESSPKIVSKRKNVNQIFLQKDSKKQNLRKPQTQSTKTETKKAQTNLNDWKRKLSSVYEPSSRGGKSQIKFEKSLNSQGQSKLTKGKIILNNSEYYTPYAKLTLGGVNVTDIEKEISHVSNKKDLPLTPILDKILSRQNSFNNDNPQRNENKSNLKVLTASDENLLQEVLDIEEKVSVTLSKNYNKHIDKSQSTSNKDSKNSNDDNTYADDFEVDNSNGLSDLSKKTLSSISIREASFDHINRSNENNARNKTYVKISNLSLKNQIETFEFIPTVDTQEIATQSCTSNKISPKETQTSPRNDVRTIRNDLSIDPRHEVENIFKLEKDFIQKLIVDEYKDFIVNLNKPSTSNDSKIYMNTKNISLIQKNTQTSPARVKSVMTSPTRTKTRPTSPFVPSVADKQTSPLIIDEKLPSTVVSENSVHLDDITVNLSSPRFQLQLPKSASIAKNTRDSRESRLDSSSSSSVEDYTSSDISFGEINKFKRRLRRHKISSISDSSSSVSKCSGRYSIVPIRSEGEVSACQTKSNKYSKSEGEASVGQLR